MEMAVTEDKRPAKACPLSSGHVLVSARRELDTLLSKVWMHAFIPRGKQPYFARSGKVSEWALDMRVPLAKSEFLSAIASELVAVVRRREVDQIAGRGFGAFLLVGAMVAIDPNFRAGILRDKPKPYGFGNLVEGCLLRKKPVIIIDDLFSTGHSAVASNDTLRRRGYSASGIVTVFRYAWRQTHSEFVASDLFVEALGTVHGNARRSPLQARDGAENGVKLGSNFRHSIF